MAFDNSAYCSENCRAHFSKRNIPFTEDAMISLLERAENKWDVLEAIIALREIGTEKAIPALKRAIYFPMSDVKCTSMLTIAKIAGAIETTFFASALEDKKYPEKGYALWALQEVGDVRGLDAVITFLTAALKRAPKANPSGCFFRSVKFGLLYISRFNNSDVRVKAVLLPWKKFLLVFRESERKQLLTAIPEFR